MKTCAPIILLEFNELCPPLLERWMAEGRLPNFKRFHAGSAAFVTDAGEQPPNLEPWIQWYSIHTGLPYRQHGVFHLTDGPKAGHADIWSILAGDGRRVMNFSSMNARRLSAPGSVYLPDPWCGSQPAYPDELNVFARFVAQQVQEYTNEGRPFDWRDHARLLGFLVSHGLRPTTVQAILGQLAREKRCGKQEAWRRAPLLDALQIDLFRHYYRKYRPDFATFFLNSTAHYQHSYWRFMEPELFSAPTGPDDLARYGGAILYGYQCMDRLLGEFFKFEALGARLVLATALSQQPYLKDEARGGRRYYRPHDIAVLLAALGVAPSTVEPVMAHQYMLRFADPGSAEQAEARLRGYLYRGAQAFEAQRPEPNAVAFGCWLHDPMPDTAVLTTAGGTTLRFFDWFYQIDAVKSGQHHPDGVLWFKFGRHRAVPGRTSIIDIFDTLLDHFGVRDKPPEARAGRSLLPMVHGAPAPARA